MAGSQTIPDHLAKLLWDTDLERLDVVANREFIIERILNMGDDKGLLWLWNMYSRDQIREVVQKSRRLSVKTARCWQNYFELREDEMRCFSTYSTSPGVFY